jgi:hypothetical protein
MRKNSLLPVESDREVLIEMYSAPGTAQNRHWPTDKGCRNSVGFQPKRTGFPHAISSVEAC